MLLLLFMASVINTHFIIKLARAFNVVDLPDNKKLKIHKKAVPLLGGAPIHVSLLMGCGLLYALNFYKMRVIIIAASSSIIFFGGLIDDIFSIRPVSKLFICISASVILLAGGIVVQATDHYWLNLLMTAGIIVVSVNAFNFIDGMDGLCTGMSLISSAGFFIIGIIHGNTFLCLLASIVFMGALGFLPYNFYPSKIFLGDAGSNLLGFVIAVMCILSFNSYYSAKGLVATLLMIGVPIFDAVWAVARRVVSKKSIFSGDRFHIYDLFLKKGLSQAFVLGIICLCQIFLLLLALGISL